MGVLEAVNRLVVIADNAHLGVRGEQLQYTLLGFVKVLKFIYENVRELGADGSRRVVPKVVMY